MDDDFGDTLAGWLLITLIIGFVIWVNNTPDFEHRIVCDSGFESNWVKSVYISTEGGLRYGNKKRAMLGGEICHKESREIKD